MRKLGIILGITFVALTGFYIFTNYSKNEFKETDLYDEIMQRGKLRVGINTDSKPFGYLDKNGKPIGYDIDLAKYIAQAIVHSSDNLELVQVTHSNRLIKAATRDVDIVISTITITPNREEIVSFSKPYDVAGQAILVRSNSRISSISDLSGQTVGVIFGTTAEKNMSKLVPNARLRGFKSYANAYKALNSGKIDAITSDDTILNGFAIDDPSVKLLPKRYSREPYGIAFKKGKTTEKLRENLNFAIDDLIQKNVIHRLRKKWNIS